MARSGRMPVPSRDDSDVRAPRESHHPPAPDLPPAQTPGHGGRRRARLAARRSPV